VPAVAEAQGTRQLDQASSSCHVCMLCSLQVRSGNATASLRPDGFARRLCTPATLAQKHMQTPGRRDSSTDRRMLRSTASKLHGSEIEDRWYAGMSQCELSPDLTTSKSQRKRDKRLGLGHDFARKTRKAVCAASWRLYPIPFAGCIMCKILHRRLIPAGVACKVHLPTSGILPWKHRCFEQPYAGRMPILDLKLVVTTTARHDCTHGSG
jgi:hypothetical protein